MYIVDVLYSQTSIYETAVKRHEASCIKK